MSKRNLATLLWFVSGWTLGQIVTWTTGLPLAVGPVLAICLAAVVRIDPGGRLWSSAR